MIRCTEQNVTGMKTKGDNTPAARRAVIIEIGGDWLKILQTEGGRAGMTLSKMYLDRFANPSMLPEIFVSAYRQHGFARIPVIISMPRQMTNIRMLELPSSDPDEIHDMVELQVGKQTPYSKEEIVYDYRILGGREGYTRVMLAIVQSVMVRETFAALEDAQIDVERVSVSTEGMLSLHSHFARGDMGLPGNIVLLDVDSGHSDFIVMAAGHLVFSRSISMGAKQLFEDDPSLFKKFVSEVKRSLETCQSEIAGLDPARILVTGAGAQVPDLLAQIQQQVGVETEALDEIRCVKKMVATTSLDKPPYHTVSIAPLLGMGLAPDRLDFDLTPDWVKIRRRLVGKARSVTAMGVMLMGALFSLSLYTTLKLSIRETRFATIKEYLQKTHDDVDETQRHRDILEEISKRCAMKSLPIQVMDELHAFTSEKLYLSSLDVDIDKGTLSLAGVADSWEDVSRLYDSMKQSKLFTKIKQDKRLENKRYQFTIECSVETGL